jgi:peptide/nickel transport system substrate-binding protein
MKRRNFLAASASLAAPLGMPRLARGQSVKPLRFVPQADLAVLDPVWTSAYVTRHHAYMVFDTLYGQDEQMRPVPQMVAGHEVTDDQLGWKLTLRPGLAWHDGTPVLARDCVASIERWSKRDTYGRTLMAATEELSAPDDRTIQFRLKRPFPQLPAALAKTANNMAAMMPERLARTDPFKQVTEMVGSGPYRFLADERVPGARAAYARFEGYVPREGGAPSGTAGPKRASFERVEWIVMPEASSAAAALKAGEVDWWELPPPDLLPLLKRDRNIAVEVMDKSGYLGSLRMNHLQPPFNNPAIRRAVLGAVSQADFMQAAAGTDPSLWAEGVGIFCPGTPMANDAGLEVLTRPRDLKASREAIQAAGYQGETVAVMAATDLPILKAVGDVTADLMQKLGFKVDYQTTDWGTVVQRRLSKEPPEKGGWSVFSNFWSGLDLATPATHALLWSNGEHASFGWPDSPRIEELRAQWLDAADQGSQQKIAAELQRQAFQDVPYVPLGQYFYATSYRKNLAGVLPGFPVFWNIHRA